MLRLPLLASLGMQSTLSSRGSRRRKRWWQGSKATSLATLRSLGLLGGGQAPPGESGPHLIIRCPQGGVLPTSPPVVFLGAAVSSKHISQAQDVVSMHLSQSLDITSLGHSHPLRREIEESAESFPASLPQGAKLTTRNTPETSLKRLVSLVDHLAVWKWVLQTVERG